MKTTKWIFRSMLIALLAIGFTACSDDDDPKPEIEKEFWEKEGAYVLSAGSNGKNNAVLGYYLTNEKKYQDIFEAANEGLKLGDTGNSMLIYGSKIYIAVSESKVIMVTDLKGKKINSYTLSKDPTKDKPRHFAADNGFVYASFFSGYVAKIDTTGTTSIVADVQVGRYPEQLKATNGKLYVANSGGLDFDTPLGYDKTVSVVDLKTFKEDKKIEVVLNPEQIQVDKQGNIYVLSKGNYGDIPNTLQKIDGSTHKVTTITNATYMAINEDQTKLYAVYNQYDANWQATTTFFSYDFNKAEVNTNSLITDGTTIEKFTSLSVNPANGDIYVTTSDYQTSGDVFIFSKDGKKKNKFSADLNPTIYFK